MSGRDVTLDVACPFCKAMSGVPCFTAGGRPRSWTHAAREELWGRLAAEAIYGKPSP